MVSLFALSLALLIPLKADQEPSYIPAEDIPNQPFVNLLQPQQEAYRPDTLKELRARIERERDDRLEEIRNTEKRWKEKLEADRRELEFLNKSSSADAEDVARRRSSLHIEIAALERGIRDKVQEREHTIPATYQLRLSKLWLAEHWPDRRDEILEEIEEGRARRRKHGDIDDIGYRLLASDSEKDIPVGEQASRQMIAGGWLPSALHHEEVQTYVRHLASKLAASSDLKIPLHVTVLDSQELKAVALPGGFVYITTGVIRAAQTESELAGVLSREIARIAARHATRTSKAAWISRFFVPVTQIVAGVFTGGTANAGAYYGIGYGIEGVGSLLNGALNGANEKQQREADQLGIQYAWKAGFDPRGFVTFLDSIAGRNDASLLGPEPTLEKRMLHLFSEIQYLPPRETFSSDSEEFQRIKRVVS